MDLPSRNLLMGGPHPGDSGVMITVGTVQKLFAEGTFGAALAKLMQCSQKKSRTNLICQKLLAKKERSCLLTHRFVRKPAAPQGEFASASCLEAIESMTF